MLFVYALTRAPERRLDVARDDRSASSARRSSSVAFILIEVRSRSPLVPLTLLPPAHLTGANIIGLLLGTMVFGMFFLLSLYMQQVLGFSALETGVGYLAVALTAVVASGARAGARDEDRGQAGARRSGCSRSLGGLLFFTQISVDGSYFERPLPGLPADRRRARLLVRAGVDRGTRRRRVPQGGGARVGADQHEPADRRRARARDPDDGLDDADRQSRRRRACPSARRSSTASQLAFWVAAAFAVVGLVATLVVLKRDDLRTEPVTEPASAQVS